MDRTSLVEIVNITYMYTAVLGTVLDMDAELHVDTVLLDAMGARGTCTCMCSRELMLGRVIHTDS